MMVLAALEFTGHSLVTGSAAPAETNGDRPRPLSCPVTRRPPCRAKHPPDANVARPCVLPCHFQVRWAAAIVPIWVLYRDRLVVNRSMATTCLRGERYRTGCEAEGRNVITR